MEIKVRLVEKIAILELSGRIDVNSAYLVESVGQCIRDGYRDILLNFEYVEYVDYMGISAIILTYKEIINCNGRLKFSNIPAHLRGIFSIAGLDRIIDIYPTEELAIVSFREDKVIEDIKRLQLRRRFRRIPLEVKVELKNKYDRGTTCFKVEMLNLSGIGAYIYGCENIRLGDEVILSFRLPPQQEEVQVEARVVWLSDMHTQPQIHPGMGVEFQNISSQLQEKIIGFVERNLSFLSTDE
ncbi:MAG: anti-sigma factor antagonist [Candidatus Omnitrophica bacterium]|nr:anti-sigma factor antagonist [Candidatus Omnitrophota bacterium]